VQPSVTVVDCGKIKGFAASCDGYGLIFGKVNSRQGVADQFLFVSVEIVG
jgi:hypothetical protein